MQENLNTVTAGGANAGLGKTAGGKTNLNQLACGPKKDWAKELVAQKNHSML